MSPHLLRVSVHSSRTVSTLNLFRIRKGCGTTEGEDGPKEDPSDSRARDLPIPDSKVGFVSRTGFTNGSNSFRWSVSTRVYLD